MLLCVLPCCNNTQKHRYQKKHAEAKAKYEKEVAAYKKK